LASLAEVDAIAMRVAKAARVTFADNQRAEVDAIAMRVAKAARVTFADNQRAVS